MLILQVFDIITEQRSPVMKRQPKKLKHNISQDQIRRSVASSCAIETGEPSTLIESKLKSDERRFPQLSLAN